MLPNPEIIEKDVLFEVVGRNRPAYLSLESSLVRDDDDSRWYLASLGYKHLSATCEVSGIDRPSFRAYFEDLGDHWRGWEGVKRVSSLDGELTICCEYEETTRPPEVWFAVRLATDGSDPTWAVDLRLVVQPEALHDLAVRAGRFFG